MATGPLFRGITRYQTLKENALSEDRIYALIKQFTITLGHGFVDLVRTVCAVGLSPQHWKPMPCKIMEVTHHASFKSLQPYIKHAERYAQHAGENLL